MASKKKTRIAKVSSFEEYLAKLEKTISDLEDGNMGLSEALEKYESGVQDLKQCYQLLRSAEKRIELLSGFNSDGEPVAVDFSDASQSLEQKTVHRSKRRSKPPSEKKDSSTNVDPDIDDSPLLF